MPEPSLGMIHSSSIMDDSGNDLRALLFNDIEDGAAARRVVPPTRIYKQVFTQELPYWLRKSSSSSTNQSSNPSKLSTLQQKPTVISRAEQSLPLNVKKDVPPDLCLLSRLPLRAAISTGRSDRDYCHWHQWWNSRGDEAHANARRAKSHRREQRRRGYISPYHESPVDLEKYDGDMDKLNADAACSVNGYDQCWASEPPRKKTKLASRQLTSACAANFELFGNLRSLPFRNR
ncbi:hypothetical protein F4679DRAFT_585598 [Xylaria curta]|nr:hypothetical protein F4679DRAFT_585598 [Xylaria curta]